MEDVPIAPQVADVSANVTVCCDIPDEERILLLVKGKKVKLSLCLSTTPRRRMGSGCIDPHFLDTALAGVEWSASRCGRFTPGERARGTH
jgi:hypothetical protein